MPLGSDRYIDMNRRRLESSQSPHYVVISTSPPADNHATSSYPTSSMYFPPHSPLFAPSLNHLSPQTPFSQISLPSRSTSGASSSTLFSSSPPGTTVIGGSHVDPPALSLPSTVQAQSSMTVQQQQEEAAYLLRRDTKERPPAHMIERQRRTIDWKSLRYQGADSDVVEELLRMTTKNLKTPTDTPKRPMNGELCRELPVYKHPLIHFFSLFVRHFSFHDLHVDPKTHDCKIKPSKRQW